MLPQEARQELIQRLRKIEGQAQGIQRMLEDGRDCREVLNQLASVRAATQRVSLELMRHYAMSRLTAPDCSPSPKAIGEVIDLLLRVPV